MNENVLLSFNPLRSWPYFVNVDIGPYLDFNVVGKEMEDISWERDKKGYYGG